MEIIKIENVSKSFKDIKILSNFNLTIREREFIAVIGESGAGKSTLLNLIGLLDHVDSGSITIFKEKNIKPFSLKSRQLLNKKIGYLFQNFALIDHESVYYNLELVLQRYKRKERTNLIRNALSKVGLTGFEHKKIYKCSGGEQQRIAIARLMLKECKIVIADEPTGSLDEKNKQLVFSLLLDLKHQGKTIIVATHDKEFANLADRQVILERNMSYE